MLKENNNDNRYGGYKKQNNGWVYSIDRTNYISLGAFFISYSDIKNRWASLTAKPFKNEFINNQYNKQLMIDKDCFGINPISAETFSNEIPFIDIGIPSDYDKAQTFIPKIINNL